MNFFDMTIPQMLNASVSKWPDRKAVVFGDSRITYTQLKELSHIAAKGLSSIGIRPGEHVAFIMANYPEFVYLQYALVSMDAKVIPINVSLKAEEIKFILKNVDVSTLIIMDRFRDVDYISILEEIVPGFESCKPGNVNDHSLPKLRNIIILSPEDREYTNAYGLNEVMERGGKGKEKAAPPSQDPSDYAFILHTSGTTAFPKGAMQSHRAVIGGGYNYGKGINLIPEDRYICFSPFFHVGGLITGLYGCHVNGATLYLTEAFKADEAARIIDREKITAAWGLGIMFLGIMRSARELGLDISSLKKATIPTGGNTFEKVVKELQLETASNSYAMTEGTGLVTINMPDDPNWEKRRNSHGKPLPGVEIRIVDQETRKPVPVGEMGEICFRGYNRFLGYYNMPEDTSAVIDDRGFFYTEDIGRMDEEGYLYWCGRYKQIVKTGGENVSQVEVETFIEDKTPWIKRAGVVGVPDRRWGEAVTALVELKRGKSVSAEEIRDYMKGKIAGFKIPRHFIFIKGNEWPLRPTKKLDKMKLREIALRKLGIAQRESR